MICQRSTWRVQFMMKYPVAPVWTRIVSYNWLKKQQWSVGDCIVNYICSKQMENFWQQDQQSARNTNSIIPLEKSKQSSSCLGCIRIHHWNACRFKSSLWLVPPTHPRQASYSGWPHHQPLFIPYHDSGKTYTSTSLCHCLLRLLFFIRNESCWACWGLLHTHTLVCPILCPALQPGLIWLPALRLLGWVTQIAWILEDATLF